MLEEKKIKVSCILRVYNGEKYIREAIDSILNQTYKDFEFIMIDDGSTDDTVKIIESYNDSRIKLYKNEKNMGLSYATNRGIELAKGEYIALVDSDDVYYNTRLEKQVKYLDENMDVGAVSACWSVNGEKIEYFFENVNIFTILLWYQKGKNNFRYAVINPTLMVRKDIFIKYGLKYDYDYNGKTYQSYIGQLPSEIERLPLWGDSLLVYGVWDSMPTWQQLKQAYEKTWWFHKTTDELRDIQLNRLLK
jgi:glycosyltransferase involved in cell wall biosynthesis